MTQWSQKTLEAHFQVHLTERDCLTINEEVEGMTWQNIEEDTRLFKDIQTYTEYVYDSDEAINSFFQLLIYLATEETQALYTAKELLLGDEVVELDGGKVMMIMG